MNLARFLAAALLVSACAEIDPSEEDVAAIDQAVNQLPSVKLTSPSAGAEIPAGTPVWVSATASDGDGSVAKVEFFANGTKLGQDTSAPYAMPWLGGTVGTYDLTAKATDSAGGTKTSPKVTIKLVPNVLPITWIDFPGVHAAYEPGDTIVVEATAKDVDGAVTSLELFANGEKIGQRFGGPYVFTWTDVPAGTYELTLRATDSAGAQAWSGFTIRVIVRSFAGGSCDGVADYDEAHGYPAGSEVQAYGNRFRCIQPGSPAGCDGPAVHAEPFHGDLYWNYWTWVSTCVPNICLGLPEYVALTAYQVGDVVQAGGDRYVCKVAAACQGPAAQFAPGAGTVWEEAWTWTDPCQWIE